MPEPNARREDFSQVQSGSSSSEVPPQGATTPTSYTVRAGDSLSRIAKELYGDATKWRLIYEANRDAIRNPDLIHPGQVFSIPHPESDHA